VRELAERAQTIPYDIICGIGRRVVRVYHASGEAVRVSTLVGAEPLPGEVTIS